MNKFLIFHKIIGMLSFSIIISVSSILVYINKLKIPELILASTFFVFASHEPLLTMTNRILVNFGIEKTTVYFLSISIVYGVLLIVFNTVPKNVKIYMGYIFYGKNMKSQNE